MPKSLRAFVAGDVDVVPSGIVQIEGMLALNDLSQLVAIDRPELKFPPYNPRFPERVKELGGDIFGANRQKDLVVHHPYEIVRRGGSVPQSSGARSQRGRDQADALPDFG